MAGMTFEGKSPEPGPFWVYRLLKRFPASNSRNATSSVSNP
jgi:hypothetical protein